MTDEQEIEKRLEDGKAILRKEGITFNLFKAVLDVLLTRPITDEDMLVELYSDYAESRAGYTQTIEEWADFQFAEWIKDKHGTMLRGKHQFEMPEDDDLIKLATVVNEGKMDVEKIGDMVAMSTLVLHRMREHGNIKQKSSMEIELEMEE